MPETIIPPGYGKATITVDYDGPGAPAMCTFGILNEGDPVADTVAQDVGNAFANRFDDSMSDQYTIQSCRVILNAAGTLYAGEFTINNPGNLGGSVSPPQVALVVKKSTPLLGRKHRGRFFLPGVPEVDVNNYGFVEDTYRAGVTTNALGLLADLNALGNDMVILHTDATDPTIVTSMACDALVGTQRRRLR